MVEREWFWFIVGSAQAFLISGAHLSIHGEHPGDGLGLLTVGVVQACGALIGFWIMRAGAKQEDRTDPLSSEREG